MDEIIPLDHPRRTPDQVSIIILCLLYTFFDIILILSFVLVFNPEKNAGTFVLDATSSWSLVPCLKLILRNVGVKTDNQR